MIVDCISDLHGYYPQMDGGDLLLLAGDYTPADKLTEWYEFLHWLKEQPYKKKVLVGGNHDNFFVNTCPINQKESDDLKEVIEYLDIDVDFDYLCDSGTEFQGLKIWGSPHSLNFPGLNPHCAAFMGTEEELLQNWKEIPDEVDILITHCPPHGILDKTVRGDHAGSKGLRRQMGRIKPKLWVFGHIHEGYGEFKDYTLDGTSYHLVNASYLNERYKPANEPVRVVIK